MDAADLTLLLTAATAAGWVDAVVGGGGLLMLPAMLIGAPQIPIATVLGTNKLTPSPAPPAQRSPTPAAPPSIGAALAVANIIGAQLGARLAQRKGASFVRAVLLTVVCGLVAKLGFDMLAG